jgi:hypothetical protein
MCHIQASGTVFHPEDFVTKPPLSTIVLHYGDTPACLVVNPRTNLQFHYTLTRPYHPSRPPYQSAPATPGTPASPCSCCSPRPSRGSHCHQYPWFCSCKEKVHQHQSSLHCTTLKVGSSKSLTLSPPCCWQTAHPAGPFCGWCVSSRGSCPRSRRWRFLRLWC